MSIPSILVYDSGLGGLSIMAALREALPDAPFVYVADTAGFPYGEKSVEELSARADAIIHAASRRHNIQLAVIACNTLSTQCLAGLRERHSMPFVGTVPAVKTAAELSKTKRFSIIATPRSAQSEYTQSLIEEFARQCVVDCVGAPKLALIAEHYLLTGEIDEQAVEKEIAPCFQNDPIGRTDVLVLGCTHYPLIAEHIEKAMKWKVPMIDPAPAIARQTARLWEHKEKGFSAAYVTDVSSVNEYLTVFTRFGFAELGLLPVLANPLTSAAS